MPTIGFRIQTDPPISRRGSVKARNDRHDATHVELKLISVGQHLVRFARLKGQTVSEQNLFWEAAATVWKAKQEYRAELKAKRVQRAAMVAAQFRLAKTADG